MDSRTRLLFVLFGATLMVQVQGQGQPLDPSAAPAVGQVGPPLDATSSIESEVRQTVYALLNESSYAGNANDANVQELVNLLMNGTAITDHDLIRLGIITISQGPLVEPTTAPPPYVVPQQPVVDPMPPVVVPMGTDPNLGIPPTSPNQPTVPQVIPTDPNVVPPGPSLPSFPTDLGGAGPATGAGAGTGPVAPSSGAPTDPFSSLFSGMGGGAGTGPSQPPPLPSPIDPLGAASGLGLGAGPGVGTSPPSPGSNLVDPLSVLAASSGLPALPMDPNALGPKPNSPLPTDLMGALNMPGFGTPPMGMGMPMPAAAAPSSGILDTAYNQKRKNSINPMMMMMMMNPEMMEGMGGGENGILMMMMMNQMMRRNRARQAARASQATQIPYSSPSASGMPPLSAGMSPSMGMPGSAPAPGGGGGFMDLLSSMGTGAGGMPPMSPMDPSGGAGGILDPTVPAGPMDFASMLNPGPGGAPGGPGDMMSFMNMINSPPTSPSGGTGGMPLDAFAPVG